MLDPQTRPSNQTLKPDPQNVDPQKLQLCQND